MTTSAHDNAVERLHAGRATQDRLSERYDASVGTSSEGAAYGRLRAASDQVSAREAWLHWIDDEGYRGLDAGPFELLAERALSRAQRIRERARLRTMKPEERGRAARVRDRFSGREGGGPVTRRWVFQPRDQRGG